MAGLIPELATALALGDLLDNRRRDAVEDNDATRSQHGEHFGHDFLQVATVSANEDGVGRSVRCNVITRY